MTIQRAPWLASASAAVLLTCGAASASAQQAQQAQQANPVPTPAAAAQSTTPARQQTTNASPAGPVKRDAPGAAKPAGYNPRFSPEGEHFVEQDGARLYQAICQGCHMPQAQGAQGAGFYPALAQNPRLAAGAYPVAVVLGGLHGMPSFAERLSDQQVANVVNYVRTHFGNDYQDAVTPESVGAQRPAQTR